MNRVQETFAELSALPETTVLRDVRFRDIRASASADRPTSSPKPPTPESFVQRLAHRSGQRPRNRRDRRRNEPDRFRCRVSRRGSEAFERSDMRADGLTVHVESGASLQALVDFTVDAGLKGLETMTGIPGLGGRGDLRERRRLRALHRRTDFARAFLRWRGYAGIQQRRVRVPLSRKRFQTA